MKSFGILLMATVLISCTTFNRKAIWLPEKTEFLEFTIELLTRIGQSDNTEIKIIFTNVSGDMIKISNPAGAVLPFCTDSIGVPQLRLFKSIKPGREIEKERITLSKGEKYETIFHFSLEQCFEINQSGTYYLWFEYYGRIFNINKEKIAGDKVLLSSKIGF